jgi:RNA polymerase sigma-70 factor (ECF subfamily)
MAGSAGEAARWLPAARAGDREALGRLLEACRHYLLRIANHRLGADLRAKGGGSDLVQQTFLEAQRDFACFAGETEADLLAWLRQLLIHNLGNFQRHYRGTGKRDVAREVALGGTGSESAAGAGEVPGEIPTPSQEAMANEEAEALERALARLPEEFRRVIVLRHQEQRTFEEIGQLLNRTAGGARTLWLRAVERLEQELAAPP